MGILYSPANVVVGQAAAHIGPADEPMPANNVEVFGDWGGNWKRPGGTEDGWKLTGQQSKNEHRIEEQASAVMQSLESRTIGIAAALAEDTLESIKFAFGGGTITTTVGVGGLPTIKEFRLSDNIDEFAIGLDMQTVGGATRRIYIPRVTAGESIDVAFRRAAGKRLWPVQFASVCKPSDIVIRDIIPAP